MTSIASPEDILKFWFEESDSEQHFAGGPDFDKEIKDRFEATIQAAKACELWSWRTTSRGRLAEIIVLDQFSRNVYRDDPRAFSSDDMACALCQELIQADDFDDLSDQEKHFALMPLMHSESLTVHQELAVPLFEKLDSDSALKYELSHLEQIERFGRYPFRNQALGRTSTLEEIAFMEDNENF